ncbi:MAG: alpha-keto acid decarboxylase family protein [Planctomycetota bacterium]|jgi:indolepyruvate decarboxylase|nr:MAG: alpha-keto acid decarboxylase family protein [Planctomycetota bacterium]
MPISLSSSLDNGLDPIPAGRPAIDTEQSVTGLSIGQYLIRRLCDYGIRHVFGLPGDYVLSFYSMLEHSSLDLVNCTREDCAGYAADAYARVNGMGAVCVTYGVGGLSLANSIAGAYAEMSPVVLISGAPGLRERINNPLLHHRVREWHTQLDVFDKICAASLEIADPVTAFRDIDFLLDTAHRTKRPVYLELPRDMVTIVPDQIRPYACPQQMSDPDALAEAIHEAVARIEQSKKPVIIAGIELHRYGLQAEVVALAEASKIAVAATLLAKSVVSEVHPLYIGLYEGALGREEVTRFVEDSDCVILLGTLLTDLDLGIFTAKLDASKSIFATSDELRISHHHFHHVLLADFLQALVAAKPRAATRPLPTGPAVAAGQFTLVPDQPITITRLVRRLNESLDDRTIVIADVGDALFASSELVVRGQTEFIAPAYYTSMGFAVPAALGAQTARPNLKVVALVGDGAFQMTGMELSTIVRRKLPVTVIVLDNKGYGTERIILDGSFNDINPWEYQLLPQVLGGGTGYEVRTEGEFDQALEKSLADTSGMSLIRVHIGLNDRSTTLERIGQGLARKV